MTVRRSRVFTTLSGACAAGAIVLFGFAWGGVDLPPWAEDLRWVLMISGITAAAWVTLMRQMATNTESFRLGVEVGQHQKCADLPAREAGNSPHHYRG